VGISGLLPNTDDIDEGIDAGAEVGMKVLFTDTINELYAMCNAAPGGMLGIEIPGNNLRWMVGVPSTAPKGKFEEYTITEQTWAVFPGNSYFGEEGEMEEHVKRIYTEWLPTSGYERLEAPEVHFLHPNADLLKIMTDPEKILNAKYEIWLPVTKK
jgi:AraC family transcriptional regulator